MAKKSNGIHGMIEKICPVCGGRFIVNTSEWVYKDKNKYYCSYTCFNNRRKGRKEND